MDAFLSIYFLIYVFFTHSSLKIDVTHHEFLFPLCIAICADWLMLRAFFLLLFRSSSVNHVLYWKYISMASIPWHFGSFFLSLYQSIWDSVRWLNFLCAVCFFVLSLKPIGCVSALLFRFLFSQLIIMDF